MVSVVWGVAVMVGVVTSVEETEVVESVVVGVLWTVVVVIGVVVTSAVEVD